MRHLAGIYPEPWGAHGAALPAVMASEDRLDMEVRVARYAVGLFAREILVDVGRVLARHHIEVMPLKGVLLRETVYVDPSERGLVDVDLAVRSDQFHGAYAALRSAGYEVEAEEPGLFEVSLRRKDAPLAVDLHQRLSASRRHRLTIDAMFGRGHADMELFGVHVILPDDYDVFAHLLAHTTLHYANDGVWHRPEDLGRFASVRRLDPATCARHLELCGLARFARLALGSLAQDDQMLRGFANEVLRDLRPDPVGAAIVGLTRSVYRRGQPGLLRRTMGVLLNPTLADAALALAGAGVRRVRTSLDIRHHEPPE